MKEIEINSDKYTVLAICFALALALLGLVSDLYNLLTHHVAKDSNPVYVRYLTAIVVTYMVVTVCLDRRLRREYPLGLAGACGLAIGALLRIAKHWLAGSAGAQLADNFLMILEILSWALVLVEGIRWFRKRIRLTQ